jgi:hypothetical protein
MNFHKDPKNKNFITMIERDIELIPYPLEYSSVRISWVLENFQHSKFVQQHKPQPLKMQFFDISLDNFTFVANNYYVYENNG